MFLNTFNNAINKYGWNNFKHVVLIDGLSLEMANIVEEELIKKYSSNIRFSTGVEPYITLNIGNKIIEEIKAFLTYVK